MQLVEIIRCEANITLPLEAQPLHVFLDGVDVFLAFFFRIGVIETQVTATAELLGHAEVQTDGFGMANMQVAIRLWRESGHYPLNFARSQIFFDDFGNKIVTTCWNVGHKHPNNMYPDRLTYEQMTGCSQWRCKPVKKALLYPPAGNNVT